MSNMSNVSKDKRLKGPFILWQDYGCEGWKPESYDSIQDAVRSAEIYNDWVITKAIDFEIVERQQ